MMRALGHEPQPSELKKLVQEVDPENTGQLDFDGYLNIILNKMAERPSQDDLHKAFRLFDPAGKRRITFDDLKRIAGQIGEDIEDGELEDMVKEADHSGTGEINQEDFFKIVTSCTPQPPRTWRVRSPRKARFDFADIRVRICTPSPCQRQMRNTTTAIGSMRHTDAETTYVRRT